MRIEKHDKKRRFGGQGPQSRSLTSVRAADMKLAHRPWPSRRGTGTLATADHRLLSPSIPQARLR